MVTRIGLGQQTNLYFPADNVIIARLVLRSDSLENMLVIDHSS